MKEFLYDYFVYLGDCKKEQDSIENKNISIHSIATGVAIYYNILLTFKNNQMAF